MSDDFSDYRSDVTQPQTGLVRCRDSKCDDCDTEIVLSVCPCPDPDCSKVAITTTALDAAEQGVAYSFTLAGDSGTWYAVGLPAGLTLVGDTISGTPTVYGSFAVATVLTDANCNRCLKSFILEVAQFHLARWSGAYWRFDLPNQLVDATGNGNTLVGSVSSLPGVINEAADIASHAIISVTGASVAFPISAGFTAAGLFKRTTSGSLGGNIVFQLTQAVSLFQLVNNQQDAFNPEPESFRFFQAAGSGVFTTPNTEFHSITPSHNVWVFFAAWLDPADNKLRYRLNDTVFTTSGVAAPEFGASAEVLFQSTQAFILDEVGFWPRALSTADISLLKARLLSGHSWPFV